MTKQPGAWFTFNGAVYVPVTWQGWATVGVGVLVIAGLATASALLIGAPVFH